MSSEADNAFIRATDDLIGLYRNVERASLDLPPVSFRPFLVSWWNALKLGFFLFVGVILIIPTNLVILIRNLFPGHWRYRPFFLRYFYYAWLWIWRGEAPTVPFVLIRPLLNLFIKGHFGRRLRRLRNEIVLHGELSDATRSALLGRLDAALERWKSPRLAAAFFTVLLPAIISLPTWYEQLIKFVGVFGVQLPSNLGGYLETLSTEDMLFWGAMAWGYVVAVPITAFLAKRGLFIGRDLDRICFPGGQPGTGAYSREREILSGVGLRAREAPTDLWLAGIAFVVSLLLQIWLWDHWTATLQSFGPTPESQLRIQVISQSVLFTGVFFIASLRRRKTGRI